jgi:putative ABC transport system substrate-binding protein
MRIKLSIFILSLLVFAIGVYKYPNHQSNNLPIIAIANYGPHSSLFDTIKGIKEELDEQGFIDDKNITYEISDVGFDSSLIPQMISKLKAKNPKIMVAMTTPVAQFAKHNIKDVPLIFNVITDPVEAALLKEANSHENNTTCVSDKQNLDLMLKFAQKLLPNAKTVGVLYSTAEANDVALVKMLSQAASANNMSLVSVPVDQPRDVPIRMQMFKDNVDFIYVGTSGPIQPTLPVIAAEADKMGIPVFNANEEAVEDGLVLASFGVNYIQIGRDTGKIIADMLRGNEILPAPIYPSIKEHQGFINKAKAASLGIAIPSNDNITIIE